MNWGPADRIKAEPLTARACLALLAGELVGRLAFARGDDPTVIPVAYRLDGGTVVCKVAEEEWLDPVPQTRVVFEVDSQDLEGGQSWCVVVSGVGVEVTAAAEVERLDGLWWPLSAAERDGRYVRIESPSISGKRSVREPAHSVARYDPDAPGRPVISPG